MNTQHLLLFRVLILNRGGKQIVAVAIRKERYIKEQHSRSASGDRMRTILS